MPLRASWTFTETPGPLADLRLSLRFDKVIEIRTNGAEASGPI